VFRRRNFAGTFVFAIAVALLAAAGNCDAQEPALPSNSPTAPGEASPTAADSAPSLIPAAPVAPVLPPAPPTPDLSQLDAAFKQTPLGKAADEYRLHVEWRKLQNRAKDDPQIVAAKKSANAARKDLEKRKLLRNYYELYYGRMREMADTPELKAFVDQQKAAHIGTTAQNTVRPSPTPPHKKAGEH
jgi:hypothetical protein